MNWVCNIHICCLAIVYWHRNSWQNSQHWTYSDSQTQNSPSLTSWWSMEAKTFIVPPYSIVDIHGAWIPHLYLSSSLLSSPPVFPHPLCSTQWLWGSPLSCFHTSGNHHPSEALIILGKEVAAQYGVQWVSQTVFMDFAKIAFLFPVGQQCAQVNLLPHFLSSQSSPFPSPGTERLSKPYRTLLEN